MSFPPEVPPPIQQDSPATGGEQVVSYRIGPGMYQIFSASIHTSNGYQEEARIVQIYEHGDATTSEISLMSGLVSENQPLSLPRERIIEGPGWIRGAVYNLAATAFTFRVSYNKYSPGQATGGFGRWF